MKSRQTRPDTWHVPNFAFHLNKFQLWRQDACHRLGTSSAARCFVAEMMSCQVSYRHFTMRWNTELWCDEAYFSRTAWIIITQYANVCWLTVWKSPSSLIEFEMCFAVRSNLSFTWSSVTIKAKVSFKNFHFQFLCTHRAHARTLGSGASWCTLPWAGLSLTL